MYINDAKLAATTRFLSYTEVYVISGLIILRDDLYQIATMCALEGTLSPSYMGGVPSLTSKEGEGECVHCIRVCILAPENMIRVSPYAGQ